MVLSVLKKSNNLFITSENRLLNLSFKNMAWRWLKRVDDVGKRLMLIFNLLMMSGWRSGEFNKVVGRCETQVLLNLNAYW